MDLGVFRSGKQSTSILIQRLDMLIGATVCALLATLAALVFRHYECRSLLPLVFIAVLMVVSQRFGAGAGILGGIAAAAVFAYSYAHSAALQNNLAWMLLLGIPASYFVASPAETLQQSPKQSSFRGRYFSVWKKPSALE